MVLPPETTRSAVTKIYTAKERVMQNLIRAEVARLRESAQADENDSQRVTDSTDWILQGRAEMARETADRLQEILDLNDSSGSVRVIRNRWDLTDQKGKGGRR